VPQVRIVAALGAVLMIWKRVILVNWQFAATDSTLNSIKQSPKLHYTPHDFRRMFITDAILNGLPPHIAQVTAGHRDINVTLGYKAVYPDQAVQTHLAFLARRRALRPSEVYRTPTDTEWGRVPRPLATAQDLHRSGRRV